MASDGATKELIQQTERKAERVWLDDGLVELVFGLFALLGGLLIFFGTRFWWVFLAIPIATTLRRFKLLPDALFRAKAALVDHRTGYVRPKAGPPSPQWPRWIARALQSRIGRNRMLRFVGAGLAFMVLFNAQRGVARWIVQLAPALRRGWPLLFWLPIACLWIGGWYYLGFRRYLGVAGAVLVAALAGPLVSLRGSDSFALDYGVQGAALVVSGALALWRYLRANPSSTVE